MSHRFSSPFFCIIPSLLSCSHIPSLQPSCSTPCSLSTRPPFFFPSFLPLPLFSSSPLLHSPHTYHSTIMYRQNNSSGSSSSNTNTTNHQRTQQNPFLSTRPRPSSMHSSPSSPISPLSTLSPTPSAPAFASASTNPAYTFSLGKPRSFRAPTTSAAHGQQSIFPSTTKTTPTSTRPSYYQPTLDQQQRMAGIYKRYDNASSATPYQRQQALLHQQNQRQRIKGVGPRQEYAPSPSNPLISLFQKMHSQAAAYQHSPQDHITSPHTHGLATVNAAEVALPPSPITASSTGMLVDTSSIEQTLRAAKLEVRQGRRELIRAKAREVRLELLALGQLEKEMDSELDDADRSYDDLEQLFSPGGSPVGSLLTPALAFHVSNAALEPSSGLVRHPPQSPHPDSIHGGGSQQFQGFQRRIPSIGARGVPSRSISGVGATHGVPPVSKLAVGAGIQPGSGTVTSTASPTSPHSSPSPPISPLSESYTVEGVIAERDRNTISASTNAQQSRKIMGWRPDVGVQDVWDNQPSQTEEDEEDGLHGYLHGSEEGNTQQSIICK